MRRKLQWLVLCLLLLLLLGLSPGLATGCQPGFQPGTFTDDLGREVRIEKVPQRIISLAPSNTEILFALGLGERIVGVTEYCNYPEEAKRIEKIGGFATADYEKIIALKPDLILAFGNLQKALVKKLEENGQTVFWIYPHSIGEILESFERIGQVTGRVREAQQLRREIEEKIEIVQTKLKDIPEQEIPAVFRVMGLNPPATIGGAAFQTDVYRQAGGRNIFADNDKDYFQFDLETLIKLDPDIIVVCGEDEEIAKASVKTQEGWGDLTAVKTDRIVVISCDLICRPTPRVAQTIEQLARKFHPGRF